MNRVQEETTDCRLQLLVGERSPASRQEGQRDSGDSHIGERGPLARLLCVYFFAAVRL